jgi:hypothetical protein
VSRCAVLPRTMGTYTPDTGVTQLLVPALIESGSFSNDPHGDARGAEPRVSHCRPLRVSRASPEGDRLAPGVRPCRIVTWLSPQSPQPIQEALPAIFNRIATHDPSP